MRLLVIALAAFALLAPAASAKPALCTQDAIQQALIDAGKLTQDAIDGGEAVDLIRRGDVTADGDADALFTVASGGTAGDTRSALSASPRRPPRRSAHRVHRGCRPPTPR